MPRTWTATRSWYFASTRAAASSRPPARSSKRAAHRASSSASRRRNAVVRRSHGRRGGAGARHRAAPSAPHAAHADGGRRGAAHPGRAQHRRQSRRQGALPGPGLARRGALRPRAAYLRQQRVPAIDRPGSGLSQPAVHDQRRADGATRHGGRHPGARAQLRRGARVEGAGDDARRGHDPDFQGAAGARARGPARAEDPRRGTGRLPGDRQEPWRGAGRFPGDRDGRGAGARRDGRHHHLPRRLGKERAGRAERKLVPGLLFYTYFLIGDKAWFDALPAAEQTALADAARVAVTEKWGEMQADDARLVAELVAHGARQAVVPAAALAPWKARTEGVTRAFSGAHPEVMRRFRAIVDAE